MELIEKKKLLYRSTHRGCKETDILLGGFAKEFLFSMTESELLQYKKIVEMDDILIYSYFEEESQIPQDIFYVFKKVILFQKTTI